MTETKPIPYNQGWGTRHKRKTQPMEPGTVCGLLTVVEQLAPGSTYTRFRCQCGEVVTRMHADVTKSLKRGSTPACNACGGKVRAAKLKGQAP